MSRIKNCYWPSRVGFPGLDRQLRLKCIWKMVFLVAAWHRPGAIHCGMHEAVELRDGAVFFRQRCAKALHTSHELPGAYRHGYQRSETYRQHSD